MKKRFLALSAIASLSVAALPAHADKLEDIISSGTLRCAVSLDVPPNGFRNEKNEPVGFDVDYCNDLAAALGVKVQIIDTPSPNRVPSLVADRADVVIAVTTPTTERAKTIGFSDPYFLFKFVVITRKDTGIKSFEDIKGHVSGGIAGMTDTLAWADYVKKLNDPKTTYKTFQSQADSLLALNQGQIDATSIVNTLAQDIIKSGKYPNLVIAGDAPFIPDYVSIAAQRQEYGLINYLNVFISSQKRTGRYDELYKKWIGSDDAPSLDVKNFKKSGA